MTLPVPDPEQAPHPAGDLERELITKLLSVAFPGRSELAAQVPESGVKWLQARGAPALVITVPTSAPAAPVRRRVPVEGEATDADGVRIHFLLHVVGGRLSEVEIFREDGEPLQRLPTPDKIRVLNYD